MPGDRRAINRANAERGHHAKFWAVDARSSTLRDLWRLGVYASEIARAIGDGCTKNMVIRRAKVLELPAREGWSKFGTAARQCRQPIRVPCETFSEGAPHSSETKAEGAAP